MGLPWSCLTYSLRKLLSKLEKIAPSVLLNPIKHHLEDLRAAQSVALGALGNRQTRGASQSLPPSFHAPANHPFKSISPDSTSKNWWIGSWNFYPHCIRCTCLNSFYWAATLELWKMENLKQKESDLGPWTCSCCRSENVVKMFSRYLVNICNNTSETVLCGCPDCVTHAILVLRHKRLIFTRINRNTFMRLIERPASDQSESLARQT